MTGCSPVGGSSWQRQVCTLPGSQVASDQPQLSQAQTNFPCELSERNRALCESQRAPGFGSGVPDGTIGRHVSPISHCLGDLQQKHASLSSPRVEKPERVPSCRRASLRFALRLSLSERTITAGGQAPKVALQLPAGDATSRGMVLWVAQQCRARLAQRKTNGAVFGKLVPSCWVWSN